MTIYSWLISGNDGSFFGFKLIPWKNTFPLFHSKLNLFLFLLHFSKLFDIRGNLRFYFLLSKFSFKELFFMRLIPNKSLNMRLFEEYLDLCFTQLFLIWYLTFEVAKHPCKNKLGFEFWYKNLFGFFSVSRFNMSWIIRDVSFITS